MGKFRFFPSDYELDDKLSKWTKSQGLTDKMIEDQLERIKDHEFNPMRSCPARTWRRWVRNAIEWGKIVPVVEREYRRPEKLSPEQEAEERRKGDENLRLLKAKIRSV